VNLVAENATLWRKTTTLRVACGDLVNGKIIINSFSLRRLSLDLAVLEKEAGRAFFLKRGQDDE